MGFRDSLKDHALRVGSKIHQKPKNSKGLKGDIRDATDWPFPEAALSQSPPADTQSFPQAAPPRSTDDAVAIDGVTPNDIDNNSTSPINGDSRRGRGDIFSFSGSERRSTSSPSPTRPATFARELQQGDTTSPSIGAVDLTIQFVGAKGLPRTDATGGGSDPYFKASLDSVIGYTSTVQAGTMEPIWNEVWHVKNVPKNAELKIKVYDKDDHVLTDDFVGSFKLNIGQAGLREAEIEGRLGKKHGTFYLNIVTNPTSHQSPVMPYTFAGPCRYSRHRSPTVGALTAIETEERLYATWKIYLLDVHEIFGDTYQHWNEKYAAAQKIFSRSPVGASVRGSIHAGHKMLYARTTANVFGILTNAKDVINLFKDEVRQNRIKPAMYTYIINDDTWRFSETGAAFFVDFASKHALHANCATQVRYSGEFHWRPMVPGGWAGYNEEINDDSVQWELVIDNNSGTYAPDKNMLPVLKRVLEHNFTGLQVAVYDHGDPALKESTAAMRQYAKERRGIKETEFTAHTKPGETTLMNLTAKLKARRHREQPSVEEVSSAVEERPSGVVGA
ncbi:hypothetical protein FRC01_003166 [Tulasnella sp. 417]|nr:hypothetical protein FRC01_003166 [Tulasnella sp. 417]